MSQETKISILGPNGDVIGYIGSLTKELETKEFVVFNCSRFNLNNASIADYYRNKKKFAIGVETISPNPNHTEINSIRQDDCFIQDHSFCFTPSVSDQVKVKAYKNPSFNKEDIENYERWLESKFIW